MSLDEVKIHCPCIVSCQERQRDTYLPTALIPPPPPTSLPSALEEFDVGLLDRGQLRSHCTYILNVLDEAVSTIMSSQC